MAKVSPLMLVPPVLFAGLAALFYFGMQRENPDELPSAREGSIAPAVALAPLGDGPAFEDADLRGGGVKLVNYWASWCAPCRAEHPLLEELAAEGIPIYGINYKDRPENALGFLDELGNPYAALGADEGRTALEWGLYGVPETYVLDGEGRIVLRLAGPITARIMEDTIRPALARAAGEG
ncbi:DsbE family thiol:disulfide interchange protein [Halodurantibacterium flavum]|uniref:DsbE family thiol:disulfide interchange protein n=1 Tax=Halodurantibacterium flavum TaxID=1382802 RepID=A0ABW4SBF2_9RHOB